MAQEMKASWYSKASLIKEGTRHKNEKQIMANGKEFDENAYTCASRDYDLGAMLYITNKANGKSVLVEVTDRIAKRFKGKRTDLSKRAFSEIANLKQGVVSIEIKEITN
jgi:rare lipoprotein A